MTKYRARRTEVDGIVFDSKREATRYQELRLLEMAREIRGLGLQATFALRVNGAHICDYVADFVYEDRGALVVEDSKGVRTPVYRLKKKLVKAIYGVDIYET